MKQPINHNDVNLFVPGRLCLFGEHSDWAAEFGLHRGYCLVTGTDQGIAAVASRSDDFTVVADSGHGLIPGTAMKCPWQPQALLESAKDQGEFFRYCAGVAYQVLAQRLAPGGIEIRFTAMDLPLKKGVASSAAVCILVAEAFNQVYGLNLFPHELMELAFLGEKLTGSECGRMDQACIYGRMPVLLTFETKPPVRVEPIPVNADIHMLLVDLAGEKDTVKILSDLRTDYRTNKLLQAALGRQNEQIVRRACSALKMGDAQSLGKLMIQAQELFDNCVAISSPRQLASPLLHQVLAMPQVAKLAFGGKGVGSQGDGTAQLVARSRADRDELAHEISQNFSRMKCFPLTIPGTRRADAESQK